MTVRKDVNDRQRQYLQFYQKDVPSKPPNNPNSPSSPRHDPNYEYFRRMYRLEKHPPFLSTVRWNVPLWLFLWSMYLLIISFFQMRMFRNPSLSPFASSAVAPSLPAHIRDKAVGDFSHRLNDMSIEIFSAPKPFVDEDAVNNRRAIRSWLRLKPKPRVTLLGYETGYDEAAAEFGLRVDRRVDKNFLGVPLFNSMLARANESTATVTVIINGDILLFDDFVTTLQRVVSTFENFLIVSARYDIDNLPTGIDEQHPDYVDRVRQHAWETGTLHTYGGMDVWAWNTNGPRLFDPVMPHFVFGRGKYDNWLTHETIAAGRRQVVDVSETCLTVHVRHDYHFVEEGSTNSKEAVNAFWSKGKKSKFELFINIYLSLHSGTYTNQKGNVLFAPWKLARCYDNGGMCLMKRVRPGICNCEYSSFMTNTQTDPSVKKGSRVIRCGMISEEHRDNFTIPVRVPKARALNDEDGESFTDQAQPKEPPFGLPLTLKSVTERVVVNNTLLLTALNFGYRGIMMNWVCNMRQLGVTNFVIAALDEALYKYAFTRGLPVYYENTIFQGANASLLSHASYGSDAFKVLTKMKSRVVVRILQLGYHVVWTDCDIVYFRNPLSDLWAHDGDLIIQTNAPDEEPLNGRRRINSGFYLAKSNVATIRAFKDVIRYAMRSRMSEQPCFYDVMCGKSGENAAGDNACTYHGMTVRMLDRFKYPNGVTGGIWNTTEGEIPSKWPNLYILHNNWIAGNLKQGRFERHGFTFFDRESELCTYSLRTASS